MYKLKVKDSSFTIPKANIGLLAYSKAMERGVSLNPNDSEGAIDYLRSIGIEVNDGKE